MKCSTKCPMEKLRAMGKACQFKDMKDVENSCKLPDVLNFHDFLQRYTQPRVNAVAKEIKKEEVGKPLTETLAEVPSTVSYPWHSGNKH